MNARVLMQAADASGLVAQKNCSNACERGTYSVIIIPTMNVVVEF